MLLYGGGLDAERSLDAVEVALPADADAPHAVRVALDEVLARWGWDHHREVAGLCASELATVALEAGYGRLALVARRGPDHLGVELHCRDASCRFADVLGTPANGRALGVVDRLATLWGVRPLGDGDAVWFELR
jgi:hypothetical protein